MKVMSILGTCPQIIKSASMMREVSADCAMELQLVQTGQHYDYRMSKLLFDELSLPEPATDLGAVSGSHEAKIVGTVSGLVSDDDAKRTLRALPNPFGDRRASAHVVEALRSPVTAEG